ncbi:MAG: putative protein tyrosine phosphatase [Candidatus Pelagisphaera sp.]|jgi:predicted protein tyrosine phosphatase
MEDRKTHRKDDLLKVLFVCSMNQWRSPTAERVYGRNARIEARSAGTSSKARRRVFALDIKWADLVLVMENKHRQRLKAAFPEAMEYVETRVLDIEDNYRFMDPELVEELRGAVNPVLAEFGF